MAKVIREDLWFCHDCLFAAVNDDYTGLDYHYNHTDALKRMNAIKAGLNELKGYPVLNDQEMEFSRIPCDCCKTDLGGSRAGFSLLE